MRLKKSGELLLLGLLSMPLAGYAQNEFQQGTEAFKGMQYQQALEFFLEAEKKGDSSATLIYNIAATYFQLGDYKKASQTFHRLSDNPKWADLAHYHLGLVAEKQHNHSRAIVLYRTVLANAQSNKLQRLAANRLAKLAPSTRREVSAKPWLTLFSVSTGFDDNAFNQQDDIQLDSSAGEDSYMEYFGWGRYALQGTTLDGWRVQGYAYSRRYSDFDNLNLNAYSLGLSRDIPLRDGYAEFGVSTVTTKLDGEDLTDQIKLLTRIKRSFGNSQISLSYQPSLYEGGSDFAHLDGWQHIVETKWRYPLQAVSVNALYRLELNDRDDLESDGDFFSYSPMRQSVGLGLDWRAQANWQVSAGIEYRVSEYDGTNRLTDTDGVFKEKTRDGNRAKAWLKTQFNVSENLRLTGRVAVTDNDENFDTYSYDKHEGNLAVEFIY